MRWIPVFQVLAFLALYLLGIYFLPSLIRRELLDFDWMHTFLQLDLGRFLGRIVSFLWVLLLYFVGVCLFLKKRAVFSEVTCPGKTFLWGALAGGGLALAMVIATVVSGAVIISSITWDPLVIFQTMILYFFAMILTATSEELALRGTCLQLLRSCLGNHGAVLAISLLFGVMHLPSLTYALDAFAAGIILGYAFLTYGIYYAIGWHFAWNWIETVFFSSKIFHFQVENAFLAGNRLKSPDQGGVLAFLVMLLAAYFYLAKRKRGPV